MNQTKGRMKKFDLIVIGAGSGLDVAVNAAESLGWQVAVVEKGPLGGTCLNRGCIPSKMLIHASDLVEKIKKAPLFGIEAKIQDIKFKKLVGRVTRLIDSDASQIEKNIKQSKKIKLYKKQAKFVSPYVIEVGRERITAKKIVIAAGSRPALSPIPGLKKAGFITSTEALRLTKKPKSLAIIGGGYIAAEIGHFYGALGTNITIIQRSILLLKNEDLEIAQKFTKIFSQKYHILLNTEAVEVATNAEKEKVVIVQDRNNGKKKKITAEEILVAAGRKPNTDLLDLKNTNIQVDKKGYIKTNQYMQTTQEGVWALGDIVGKAPFKHTANKEAEVVYNNLANNKRKMAMDYSIVPHAVFSSPQIASVGITEEQAKEQKISYEVKKGFYKNTGMGQALAEEDGFVKFIIDPQKETILGCHIMGPDAATLIHEVIVAMSAVKGKISAITDSIYIHPALSEVIQRSLW